jgi:hypothetical protein
MPRIISNDRRPHANPIRVPLHTPILPMFLLSQQAIGACLYEDVDCCCCLSGVRVRRVFLYRTEWIISRKYSRKKVFFIKKQFVFRSTFVWIGLVRFGANDNIFFSPRSLDLIFQQRHGKFPIVYCVCFVSL